MPASSTPALPSDFLGFVWHFLKNYKTPALAFIFCSLAAGAFGPINSYLVKNLIDALPLSQGSPHVLYLPAALFVLNFIVLDNVTWRSIGLLNARYQGAIKSEIITALCNLILTQPHQFFSDRLSGRLANQITTLADNIETILHRIGADFIRGISVI